MKLNKLFVLSALMCSLANNSHAQQGPSGGPAGLREAIEACKSKGKPGDSAFEDCMTEKGFTKPSGPRPQGGHHGMQDSNNSSESDSSDASSQ